MILHEPPSDFNSSREVVGCYILHNGSFVLLQRNPTKSFGGCWGLPAGKVDHGEGVRDAIVREVSEETGIVLTKDVLEHRCSVAVRHDGNDFMFHMFAATLAHQPEIRVEKAEHQAFAWVSPAQAAQMELVHDMDECNRIMFGEGSVARSVE